MRAGQLRNRIAIGHLVQTGVTELNEPVMTRRTWRSVWCEVSDVRGTEKDANGQVYDETLRVFSCRFMDVRGLDATMTIAFKGQVHNIKNIRPDYQRQGMCAIETTVQDQVVLAADLEIFGEPTIEGVQGSLYQSFFSCRGGKAPYTFSISAGALPTGVTMEVIDDTAITIVGTPSVNGTFAGIVVTATDAVAATAAATPFTITIDPTSP